MEIPRESVRLMAESTGLELSDEVAALLAEDVCYRLREATQVRSPPHPQLSFLPPSPGIAPLLSTWAPRRQSRSWASAPVHLAAAPLGSPASSCSCAACEQPRPGQGPRLCVSSAKSRAGVQAFSSLAWHPFCPAGPVPLPHSLTLPLLSPPLPSQNSSQFMKHTKRRKLTVEDFNRALRWSSVEVSGPTSGPSSGLAAQ